MKKFVLFMMPLMLLAACKPAAEKIPAIDPTDMDLSVAPGADFYRYVNGGWIVKNPLKYEALLPNHVGMLVEKDACKVKVLTSEDSWFGVTYKEDRPSVVAKIQALKDNGTYPDILFA